jgi:UDP-N-acetylmuramate dehydrogenase
MASWQRIIETSIDQHLTESYWSEPLSEHATFRIGGNADCFIIINNLKELINILRVATTNHLSMFVIGCGSNLLISDQGIRYITVKLGKTFSYIKRENSELRVGAATKLSQLVKYAFSQSLGGVEFLLGIPGTLGGAVVSNAGAFSQDIGSRVTQINGILPNNQEVILNRNQLKFEYRKSNLPYGFIITEATLNLHPENQIKIKQTQEKYQKTRRKKQPWGASAGSVFKNPRQMFAGKLIQDSQLKGIKIKGAYISKKHSNFIINEQNAKFTDVYELIQLIKSSVESKTGIILEEEIQILPKVQEVKKWQNQKKY